MKKLKMQKDYWFPSRFEKTFIRKRSIANLFNMDYDYESDLVNSSQIHWSSTTAQPRRIKFVIPIGDMKDKPSIAKRIKDLIKNK